MVDLVPRFYDVTAGRLLIDGHDVREISVQSLRRLMGIVTQETFLFNTSIRENIAYGEDDAPMDRIIAAAKAANAHAFISETPQGYDTIIGDRGVKLSGGQRQRLSIARAIYKNPPILILDEATSSLDTESEVLVQNAIENLMQGRTSIVIAHRLSTIKRADRIYVLDTNGVAEVGTHEELLARGGLYHKLYQLQFQL
jgi:subfamily B ATP-binding cassette protein MsbA